MPPKMLGGHSVTLLTTYLDQLGYIGFSLGTTLNEAEILMAPAVGHTRSEGETLELLLTTHFPNSGITQEVAAPAGALLARRSDWRLSTTVVTYRSVEWAIDYFAHIRDRGGWHIPGPVAKGAGGCHSIPGQNISYLPGDCLCSSHMATG